MIPVQALGSYFTQRQPLDTMALPGGRKKKPVLPKKIKSKYNTMDVIKILFKDRIAARTQEIFIRDKLPMPMNALKKAQREIERELTDEEQGQVGLMLEDWNSGHIVSESARCL